MRDKRKSARITMRVTDGMIAGILNFGERPGKIFEKDQNF